MSMSIGRHMSITDSISSTLILAHRIGASAIQISLGAMDKFTDQITLEDADITRTLKIKRKYNKYIVVHGKFLYNLCRVQVTAAIKSLVSELDIASQIEADVIIHQGKNVPQLKLSYNEAMRNFIENVKTALDHSNGENRLLLENSAHQGTEIGYSLDQLAETWHMFPETYRKRLGFCIDTCHLYVAGELDINNSQAVVQWFEKFDKLIGLEYLKVVHFNDSNRPFDSHNDNHASLGLGYISLEALKKVATICFLHNIPLVMETPAGSYSESEITMVTDWYKESMV